MLSEIELLKLEFQRQILTGKLSFSAQEVLNIIKDISFNPKLIMQIKKYLEFRLSPLDKRIINIKGKPFELEDKPLDGLSDKRVQKVNIVLREKLKQHLSTKELF